MTIRLLQAAALAAACALAACNSRTYLPQASAPAKPAASTTAGQADPVAGFKECRQFFPSEQLPRVPDLQVRKPRDLCEWRAGADRKLALTHFV